MHGSRRGALVAFVVVVAVLVGGATAWYLNRPVPRREAGCTVTGPPSSPEAASEATLAPVQADNAATIAAVGIRLGMPDHAVTIALATAIQESHLINLTGGDLDSAGLFQQRPSQGWGTYAQVTDPVHAATAFYDHLRSIPNWPGLDVTEVAQLIQHSATPDAYAQWEPTARTIAAALTGESPAALTCHDLTIAGSTTDLAAVASAELGTAELTGHHDAVRGWALSSWLVAHAARFGIDQVIFDGHTWTASTGAWTPTNTADGMLTLHRLPPGRPTNSG